MEKISILGIDVAKNVFSLCEVDKSDHEIVTCNVKRAKLLEKVLLLAPEVIAMEACGKSQKNDAHDARAIAEACGRPNMRFVGIRTQAHQDIQCIHSVLERLIRNRTSIGNEIRGFLAEYGIITPKGIHHVRNQLPSYFEDNRLTLRGQNMCRDLYDEFVYIDQAIARCNKRIEEVYLEHKGVCDLMMQVEGVGIICATALLTVL